MREARVTINNTMLGPGHSITLRIAVQRMLEFLEDPSAYGDDKTGRLVRQQYIDRLTEMQVLLHQEP